MKSMCKISRLSSSTCEAHFLPDILSSSKWSWLLLIFDNLESIHLKLRE